jgi:hypothetical protein
VDFYPTHFPMIIIYTLYIGIAEEGNVLPEKRIFAGRKIRCQMIRRPALMCYNQVAPSLSNFSSNQKGKQNEHLKNNIRDSGDNCYLVQKKR